MDFTLGCEFGPLQHAEQQSAVEIRFDTWVQYPSIAAVGLARTATIHRSELRHLARETWSSGVAATSAIERLFVLTMMWGSGTTNGRGPRYTDEALSTGRVPDVLASARAMFAKGEVGGAYGLHRQLAGVGPAFFTKMLWALGQTVAVAPEPLILDSRVWESLKRIKWDSRRASGSRKWGDRYRAYLNACGQWAEQGFTAEDVEYTLFCGVTKLD